MLMNEPLDPSSTESAADVSNDEYARMNMNRRMTNNNRNRKYDQDVDDDEYDDEDNDDGIQAVDDDEVLLFKNALLGHQGAHDHGSSSSAIISPSAHRRSAASPTESSFALTSAPGSPGSMVLRTEDEIHLNDLMSLRDDSDD